MIVWRSLLQNTILRASDGIGNFFYLAVIPRGDTTMPRHASAAAALADETPETGKTPADIAAAAAAFSEGLRRSSCREDVRRWRAVVDAIADGHEPDGNGLAEIATLAARLKLPEGSLARHVDAVTLERRLRADLAKAEADSTAAETRAEARTKEIESVQRRLHELRVEAETAMWRASDVGNLRRRIDDHHLAHRLIWADIDTLATTMIHENGGLV